MQKKIIVILFLIVCLCSGYFFASKIKKLNITTQQNTALNSDIVGSQTQTLDSQATSDSKDDKAVQNLQPYDPQISQKIQQKVPFVVQAPFGNWKDPIFQNACEEAAMIMAMDWTSGIETILAKDAQKQIKNIVDFEDKKFGYNTDTDIQDMQIVFQNFFHYQYVNIQENISPDDIKSEIQKGNVVLVPAFGQALGNPNYTSPGPVAHMLVIIGYDPNTKNFITNDSGTRHGSGYIYPENILFGAIWEYSSGSKVPKVPTNIRKKGMLVVEKSQ